MVASLAAGVKIASDIKVWRVPESVDAQEVERSPEDPVCVK